MHCSAYGDVPQGSLISSLIQDIIAALAHILVIGIRIWINEVMTFLVLLNKLAT